MSIDDDTLTYLSDATFLKMNANGLSFDEALEDAISDSLDMKFDIDTWEDAATFDCLIQHSVFTIAHRVPHLHNEAMYREIRRAVIDDIVTWRGIDEAAAPQDGLHTPDGWSRLAAEAGQSLSEYMRGLSTTD